MPDLGCNAGAALPRLGCLALGRTSPPTWLRDFEVLYARHQQLVYTIAFCLLRNHHEAEDVVQHVFLMLWANPFAFRGGNFEAWLRRVARNRCLSMLRRRRPISLSTLSAEDLPIGASMRTVVEDEVLRKLAADRIHQAFDELKPSQRPMIVAAFIEHETHETIAKIHGMPLGTVKTRIRSALRRMRRRAPELRLEA